MIRSVQWLWALSVAAQVAVFWLLIYRRHFRRLPFFTAYVTANLCQAVFLVAVYIHSGFNSSTAFTLAWAAEAITLIARAFAITEIIRLVLGPYRGVWALGWRLLTGVAVVVIFYATIGVGGSMDWIVLAADRGFHLAFAAVLVGFFLLVRYYAVPIRALHRALLGGFCFYSCTVVLTNTLYRVLFLRSSAYYEAVWGDAKLLAYIAVQAVWAVALLKPLPVVEQEPVLLPASV